MTYTMKHVYVDTAVPVTGKKENNKVTIRFSKSGTLPIRFPGFLRIGATARYSITVFVPGPEGQTGKWKSETRTLPLTVEIRKPDGTLFTGNQVSFDDINEFRDLRGTSQGEWTYKIHGASAPISILVVENKSSRVTPGSGHVFIGVDETVRSRSAPPLVNETILAKTGHLFRFDLFRVGTLIATAPGMRMKLSDPDGVNVATSTNGRLSFPVTLETLDRSRDTDGNPCLWSLQVFPSVGSLGQKTVKVSAGVMQTARIRTSVLQERIDTLIGMDGKKLSIFGETTPSDVLVRLTINDEVSAETIDMHDLLDSVIESVPQDDSVTTNIASGVTYNLAKKDRDLGYGITIASFKMKLSTIKLAVGASEKILPSIPALKLSMKFSASEVKFSLKGFPVGSAKIRDNQINLEVGVRLNANGTYSPAVWMDEDPLDVDLSWQAILAAGATSALVALGAVAAAELAEEFVTDIISGAFRKLMTSMMEKVPQILAVILGDDFTYRAMRLAGDDILFDYVAPLESDPKPSKRYDYLGIMGRSATQIGPRTWNIRPILLGDTWSAQNLNKIDHVVVVMMENRSFDHVLGYRAQLAGLEASDGLSTELLTFLDSKGFPLRKLNQSEISPKTAFPRSVGHELSDVTQQLSKKLKRPSGPAINSPQGFLDNFAHKHPSLSATSVPKIEDVLGYYEAADLPFYKFLAENYAYSEKYFCSHPGPTLPNRMYSLTGDVQYDRTGEAILDNNNGDNFSLSRAMTIFDMLTRKRVSWRVYESFPSVTMLRMFARYATDDTNIIDIKRLQQDIDQGNLPAVTFVEPAMHHFPPNDDHPPADMAHGQLFLKGVYESLRSNADIWRKTMLIITYDEHGGLYDHVNPPIADILMRPLEAAEDLHTSGGHFAEPILTINYGLRVPTFVVSPWVPVGKGPDIVLDHCSILKTILARFCGQERPFLSARVNSSRTFDAFLSEDQPRMSVPKSPAVKTVPAKNPAPNRTITTEPISRIQMRAGNVDYHDLTGMLARLLGR